MSNSASRKGKDTLVCSPTEGDSSAERHDETEVASVIPDWRLKMIREIRAAIAETVNERQAQLPIGPSEIDTTDVVNSDQLVEMMRKIDSNNAANKTVNRLALQRWK